MTALVGGFALGADGSGHGGQDLLWRIFTIPGGVSLNLTHGGASSLFKHFLGEDGAGPAAIQMVLISFVIWTTLIGVVTFICLSKTTRRIT
jgi:hypothetical protein